MAQVGEKSGFGLDAGFSADVTQDFLAQFGDAFSGGRGSSHTRRLLIFRPAELCSAGQPRAAVPT